MIPVLAQYIGPQKDPVFIISIKCTAGCIATFAVFVDDTQYSESSSTNYERVKADFDIVVATFKTIYRKQFGFKHCVHCGAFLAEVKSYKIVQRESDMRETSSYEDDLCPDCFKNRFDDPETISMTEGKEKDYGAIDK